MFGGGGGSGFGSSVTGFGQPSTFGQNTNSINRNPFAVTGSLSPATTAGNPLAVSSPAGNSILGQASNTLGSFGTPSPFNTSSASGFSGASTGVFGGFSGLGTTAIIPSAVSNPSGYGSAFGQHSAGAFGGSSLSGTTAFAPGGASNAFGSGSVFGQNSTGVFGGSTGSGNTAFAPRFAPAVTTNASGSGSIFGQHSTGVFGGSSGSGTTAIGPSVSTNPFGHGSILGKNSSGVFGGSSGSGTTAFAPSVASTLPAFGTNSSLSTGAVSPPVGSGAAGSGPNNSTTLARGPQTVSPFTDIKHQENGMAKFTPTYVPGESGKLLSISAMASYQEKSHEELRFEEYQRSVDEGLKSAAASITALVQTSSAPSAFTFPVQSEQLTGKGLWNQDSLFKLPLLNPPNGPQTSNSPSTFTFPSQTEPSTGKGLRNQLPLFKPPPELVVAPQMTQTTPASIPQQFDQSTNTITTPVVASPFGEKSSFRDSQISSMSVQRGISSISISVNPTPVRVSKLTARNLTLGRVRLSFGKYKPNNGVQKVPFFDEKSSGMCKATTSIMPRQNPRDWVLNPMEEGPQETKSSKSPPMESEFEPGSSAECKINIKETWVASAEDGEFQDTTRKQTDELIIYNDVEQLGVLLSAAVNFGNSMGGGGGGGMKELEYLSLVSKVCSELETHLGVGDRVLGEFVIEIGRNCEDIDEFVAKLKKDGAEMPDYLVRTLLSVIHAILPVNKAGSKSGFSSALKIADSRERTKDQLEREIDLEAKEKQSEHEREADFGDRKKHRDGYYGGREKQRSSRRDDNEEQERRGSGNDNDTVTRGRKNDLVRRREDDEVELYKVYRGRVSRVMKTGCFVRLIGFRGKEGLVHVSQMAANSKDVVKTDQQVYVKVISFNGQKLGLSMRDVDQHTGKDLLPLINQNNAEDYGFRAHPSSCYGVSAPRGLSGISLARVDDDSFPSRRRRRLRRMSSPEKWELKQLIASGVLSVKDHPMYDDQERDGLMYAEEVEGAEEELEIELNENEPVFLQGQSRYYSIDMSPVRILKNPEGSLSRAAALQSALIKERREVSELPQRTMLDSIPKDLNRPWEDPMPETGERRLAQELRRVGLSAYDMPEWKKNAYEKAPSFGPRSKLSIRDQRQSLPIYKLKNEIIQAIRDNQVLVVIGETGSGKTTQLTQYLAEAGYTTKGKIGCTQPRRVAVTSVAKRVAEEFGCRLGEEVGYAIRFEECTGPETVIKYMTDGMLLREILGDENLSQYSVIMLDEAHERTIHTDVLFGLLKQLVKRRPDLRLIITSATLDAEKFSSYFFNSNIFTIPGRTFNVEIFYSKQSESDYVDSALEVVMEIHLKKPKGDILLFLTGQEEIEYACERLYERMKALGKDVPELIILPVYGALPSEIQTRIFEPAPRGKRKVVVATNIAEASLTIDGIFYVIDPGYAKQNVYNPKQGLDSLVITPISQASAKQRAGRAGRTGPGECYRLYTESAFHNEMEPTTSPEILRSNLGNIALTMKAMGINDLLAFDFMDPPSPQALISAMKQLYTLGALDEEGLLTKLGRTMAEFPLEPPLSRMLLASVDLGCSDEILTIIAMVHAGNIFYRPREKQGQADEKKAKFCQPEGDHLTLLAVYEAWKANNFSAPWCFENYVQSRSLRKAQDARKQLVSIMDKYRLDVVSAGKDFTKIRKAITAGFFFHAARKDPQEGYRTLVENQPVYIYPGSSLFQRQPDWVIYHELLMTTKEYMHEVTVIDPKWLVELAPRFFKASDPTQLSKRKRQQRIEPLLDGLPRPADADKSKISTDDEGNGPEVHQDPNFLSLDGLPRPDDADKSKISTDLGVNLSFQPLTVAAQSTTLDEDSLAPFSVRTFYGPGGKPLFHVKAYRKVRDGLRILQATYGSSDEESESEVAESNFWGFLSPEDRDREYDLEPNEFWVQPPPSPINPRRSFFKRSRPIFVREGKELVRSLWRSRSITRNSNERVDYKR
ncbi:OLC1v1038722C1 [Oldenlandia corymbosa var. corymbosa]|uniref:RNA helicase n=1 Tax=Oldenlandia corymbosa var. corymbosa TaxID=529605 RepID=A0AAV1D118_OLDCO|nr:OLC1v1038722C1 [Oldenlandia corymbosa var. corymbosa]